MTLCRVTGTVVATAKIPALRTRSMLICRPVDPTSPGVPTGGAGSEMIAVDTVSAGEGDLVLVCDEGNAARLIIGDSDAPVRTVIVAVVDEVSR